MAQEWSADQVRTFVFAILDERERKYDQRFRAQQDALAKADEAVQRQAASVASMRSAIWGLALTMLAGIISWLITQAK